MKRRDFFKASLVGISAVTVGTTAKAESHSRTDWVQGELQLDGTHGFVVVKEGMSIVRFTANAVKNETIKIEGMKLLTGKPVMRFESILGPRVGEVGVKIGHEIDLVLFADYEASIPIKYGWRKGILFIKKL